MKNNDITTNGFLSDNCYQSVITKKPDKNALGLVKQRQSALANAKSDITVLVTKKLTQYCMDRLTKRQGSETNQLIQSYYEKVLEKYVKKGYIAYTFYDKNNAVVIVYRINSNNIKQTIESIEVPKEFLQKSDNNIN